MSKKLDALTEREATRRYTQTLREVLTHEGLLSAIGYEVRSTVYSIGKRISGLFDVPPNYSASELHHSKQRLYEAQAHERRRQLRKTERHEYILRKERELSDNVLPVGIVSTLIGAVVLGGSITGNAIATVEPYATGFWGGLLVITGLVLQLVYYMSSRSRRARQDHK